MYVYVYVCVCMYVYIYISIHTQCITTGVQAWSSYFPQIPLIIVVRSASSQDRSLFAGLGLESPQSPGDAQEAKDAALGKDEVGIRFCDFCMIFESYDYEKSSKIII